MLNSLKPIHGRMNRLFLSQNKRLLSSSLENLNREPSNGFKEQDDGTIFGSTSVTIKNGCKPAFEYKLFEYDYINKARTFPGNVFFHLTKSMDNPNNYRWFECWDNINSVYGFMRAVGKKIFVEDNEMISMLEGGKLNIEGGFKDLIPLEKAGKVGGVIEFDVEQNAKQVWSIYGDWSKTATIPRTIKVENGINDNPLSRRVYFSNDPQTDPKSVEPGLTLDADLISYDTSNAPYQYRLMYHYEKSQETIDVTLTQNNNIEQSTKIRCVFNIGNTWPNGKENPNAFKDASYIFKEKLPPFWQMLFQKQS